ncbi:MAG: sugar transferase [Candidatus Omnitrophica bacterium]|nr:sugar transferase [Candidatus Omnitrophota bacterium]
MKRIFDFSLALTGLILSSPLWAVIAAAVWLESGLPVFYSQDRTGKDGKVFKLWKFRSMVKDAEKNTGVVWAAEHDPRVTKVGWLLRETAMDELPQLWNILKGDMSFVGPRSERPELVEKFVKDFPDFNKRHAVIPGLTGVAQILGSAYTEPKVKFRYDMWYIKHRSFWLDIYLIFLSFIITFQKKWEIKEDKFHILGRRFKEKVGSEIKDLKA